MKTIAAGAVTLAWGLWFGGVITLFIFAQRLFSFDHDLAAMAAPHLFLAFARYQIVLAAVALTAMFAWRLAEPSGWANATFLLLTTAFAAALWTSFYVTPHLEALRTAGETHGADFRR